jgi:hypothetical protein
MSSQHYRRSACECRANCASDEQCGAQSTDVERPPMRPGYISITQSSIELVQTARRGASEGPRGAPQNGRRPMAGLPLAVSGRCMSCHRRSQREAVWKLKDRDYRTNSSPQSQSCFDSAICLCRGRPGIVMIIKWMIYLSC